jgi:hypothetical protein
LAHDFLACIIAMQIIPSNSSHGHDFSLRPYLIILSGMRGTRSIVVYDES